MGITLRHVLQEYIPKPEEKKSQNRKPAFSIWAYKEP